MRLTPVLVDSVGGEDRFYPQSLALVGYILMIAYLFIL